MATNEKTTFESLKIALVHDALTIPGGAEQVLYELHSMFPDAPIYTPLYRPEKFPQFKDAKIVPSSLNRFSYLRNHHQIAFPLLPYAVEQFDLSQFDIVISDSTAAAKGALTRPETVHICYCHTPMRWAWMPYLDPRAASSWIRRVSAHYLRIWDSATVDRVDVWLANAKTSSDRVRKFYHREAKVVYPPVAVENIKAAHNHEGYFLTIGRLVEQKRVDIIIEAAKKSNILLQIAGSGPLEQKLKQLAKGAKNIKFLGYVTEEEKQDLYAKAQGFIFASEEDFGIVPIEAMAWGKPVIAYEKGGAGETVLHKVTGIHFDEQTPESLGRALEQFESISFDADKIAEHAQQFSAARFRKQIHDVIAACLNKQS